MIIIISGSIVVKCRHVRLTLYNSKIAGSSPALAIMLDLFLVVQSSNHSPHLYIIANWLPPASWVFNPVMLYLNYLFLRI